LEKHRQASNRIRSLKDANNVVHSSDENILKIAREFYTDLYSSNAANDGNVDTYLSSFDMNNFRTLSNIDRDMCEGLVTLQECTSALDIIKKNKAPGLDGLSIEFYVKFWDILGPVLVSVYNESFEKGVLPESQRESVFSLI
jgi:hypothetical protein